MQTRRRPPTTKAVAPPVERKAHDAELIDEMDDLLDEIDRALEDNALETVRLYRQHGGE